MSEHATSHAVEATLAATGSKATYTGAGMTIGSWFLSSEFGVLMGVFIGVLGLGVQWYYRHKLTKVEIRLKEEQAARDREAHAARMGMYQ
jgi:ABC-type transport system involved in cytochrome bd biosynthesis fused ATPase/permease subunit